jgi:hypothetical protein
VFGGTIKTGQAIDSWFGALDDDLDNLTVTATGSLPQGLTWTGGGGLAGNLSINLLGTPCQGKQRPLRHDFHP